MRQWIWECPLNDCDGHGIKLLSHPNALHNGKWHLIDVHGLHHIEPILKKVKN